MSNIFIVLLSAFILLAGPVAADKKADAVAKLVIEQRKLTSKNTFRVKEGQVVELRWMTDEDVELHLHG